MIALCFKLFQIFVSIRFNIKRHEAMAVLSFLYNCCHNYIKRSELGMDHDDFYDKLPYTLTEEQTTPEYVIFGTGLQECLIAAYKSKS